MVILKLVKMDLDGGPGGSEVTLVIRVRLFFLFISFPFFKCRHTPPTRQLPPLPPHTHTDALCLFPGRMCSL